MRIVRYAKKDRYNDLAGKEDVGFHFYLSIGINLDKIT